MAKNWIKLALFVLFEAFSFANTYTTILFHILWNAVRVGTLSVNSMNLQLMCWQNAYWDPDLTDISFIYIYTPLSTRPPSSLLYDYTEPFAKTIKPQSKLSVTQITLVNCFHNYNVSSYLVKYNDIHDALKNILQLCFMRQIN